MLNALKSASKNPILQSAGKTAVLLSVIFFIDNFWWSAALFILFAFYFYRRGVTGDISLSHSFFVFLGIVLVSRWFIPLEAPLLTGFIVQNWFFGMIIILSGLSFFIILGLKNLLFLKRSLFYHFLNNFLFLSAFLIFFFLANPDFFWLKYLAIIAAMYCLFKEFLLLLPKFSEEKSLIMPISKKKAALFALCLAFLASQLLWANSLLPIGFLNSSAIMMVIVLIFKDLTANYFIGLLNKRLVLKNITIFVIFTLIIFMASKWAL